MKNKVPAISVIIPAYGRPRRLQQCVQALLEQDYPPDRYEIVVVDDGSHSPLADVLPAAPADRDIRIVRQKNAGPAAARNRGARLARYPYLAFTDDDCLPAPSWLSFLSQVVMAAPASMVGGHTVNALADNMFSAASQLLVDYLYQHFNRDEAAARFFTSNNFICPAERFWRVGGFDPDIQYAAGEDREFCDRWRLYGEKMIYEPRAKIFHYHHLGLVAFIRQHFNYGRGAWLFHQIRSRRRQEPVRMESFRFYRELLLFPLRQRQAWFWPLVLLMGVTQAANAAGFFWQMRLGGRPKSLNQTD